MVVLGIVGCLALLLFCSRLVTAQQMEASWYGPGFEGNDTANGEVFDPSGYTAAHKTYAFGTKLIVTYEGRSVVVRINDRGPYVAGRELDLAQGAAEYLGLTAVGVDIVDVQEAAASTPVGPYSAPSNSASVRPTQQAAPAASDAPDEPNQDEPARRKNGREAKNSSAQAVEEQYTSEDQYAAEDQYVADNQGQQVTEVAPPAPPAPKPAVPVLPPEPEPEALLSPPAELAVPNSTVKKRVELEVAAEPTPQPVEEEAAEPASEPVEEEAVEPAPEPVEEKVAEPVPEPPAEEPEAEEPEAEEPEAEEPEIEKPEIEKPEIEKPKAEGPGEELTVLPDTGGAPLSIPAAGALLVALGISVRILRR